MTFIGAGQPYVDGQLLHVIILNPAVAIPWNQARWSDIQRVVGDVPQVLSCVARRDRCGEITITVSDKLSREEHQGVLDAVITALVSLKLHAGNVTQKALLVSDL